MLERRSRDSRISLGKNVVIIEGGFDPSGGSTKYPEIGNKAGTILEIRDVPLSLAKKVKYTNFSIIRADVEDDPRMVAIKKIRELMTEHSVTLADLRRKEE